MRDRLRQRALISLLQTHDGPPTILARQIFFLYDAPPSLAGISDNMTTESAVVAVGKVLYSAQRLREDVDAWARNLFNQAGLPFVGNSASGTIDPEETPVSGLSVVPSQPATTKAETPSPKRKSRRVYLELAIKLLERGSCTHKALVDAIMEQHPGLNRQTVETFGYDVQNPKYSPIRDRKVLKQADGTLIFEDSVRPMLTVIENPNFSGTDKTEAEPVTNGKQANRGDL